LNFLNVCRENFTKINRVRKLLFFIVLIPVCQAATAQKLEHIQFNLYTDSLKKGFYNYISVDGKYSDGSWLPLDSSHIKFTANTGYFKGNDIFIDSAYKGDSIVVKAILRSNPAVCKEVTIYIRKRGFDEPLKTNEEILQDMRNRSRKNRQRLI
jgi:hypothetical protein